jgi:hypothetical protein
VRSVLFIVAVAWVFLAAYVNEFDNIAVAFVGVIIETKAVQAGVNVAWSWAL